MSMGLAMSQVQRIEGLCNFLEHPGIREAAERHVPVTMPRDVGALGFDRPLWLGLGIVGVWAALDAYAERYLNLEPQQCAKCGRKCLSSRYGVAGVGQAFSQPLDEIEDLRHLFAHNFAGVADDEYLQKKRHILRRHTPLNCHRGLVSAEVMSRSKSAIFATTAAVRWTSSRRSGNSTCRIDPVGFAGCAQGAESQLSCGVSRTFAHCARPNRANIREPDPTMILRSEPFRSPRGVSRGRTT
jgi:hypothetical protein